MRSLTERLKVAQAEMKIAARLANQANKRVQRLLVVITALEKRIELKDAK